MQQPPPAVDSEAQKRKLAALVREYGSAKVQREASNTVLVWPNLLVIEFLVASILTLGLVILSTLVNSPLEDHSNPDLTPNPSKAPWYFLNLQELLLHMDPALAGVLVPTAAIVALMLIPYFDNVVGDTGVWYSTAKGRRSALIGGIYAAILLPVMILFDAFVGVKPVVASIPIVVQLGLLEAVAGWIIPTILMVGLPIILVKVLLRPLNPSKRDIAMALFTGFVVTYVILTVVGTAFRGHGMGLFWPWDVGPTIQ